MEERELLHTDRLSVGYHGKELIKEIEISLKMGEIVTLIGPNGAGKSTILKTIAKQLQEIRGSVYVGNTNIGELPEKELAKKMSIVFTERITPELMTVADVVAMGRVFRKKGFDKNARIRKFFRKDLSKFSKPIVVAEELQIRQNRCNEAFLKI